MQLKGKRKKTNEGDIREMLARQIKNNLKKYSIIEINSILVKKQYMKGIQEKYVHSTNRELMHCKRRIGGR